MSIWFLIVTLPKIQATSVDPYFVDCGAISYNEQQIIEYDTNTNTTVKKFYRINNVFDDKTNESYYETNDSNKNNDNEIDEEENHEVEQNFTDTQFQIVDEYLYVNTKLLNIRTGPGTNYDAIGSFNLNDKVHVIGIGQNGWSKIKQNDKEFYVYSSYLSKSQVHVETFEEEMQRRGNIGRLKIKSVDLDVALFKSSIYDLSHSQPVVDRTDSAAYLEDSKEYYGFIIIADHVHQGFSKIKQSVPNKTVLEINFKDKQENYICIEKIIGYNGYDGKTGIFDVDGKSIAWRHDNGICLYTCNSDGTITITFWEQV